MSKDKIYTTKEAAELLGVSVMTILRYIKDEKIAATKVFGVWKIKHSALEPYLEYVK